MEGKGDVYKAGDELRVVQCNLHHSRAATATLCRHLDMMINTIALIQEPWVFKSKVCGFSGLSGSIFSCPATNKVRTAIYVPKHASAHLLPQHTGRDITSIRVRCTINRKVKEITMASVYLPYEDQPPSQGLERLAEDARKGNWNLVIGCDSNAHSTAWGSADDNGRGSGSSVQIQQDTNHEPTADDWISAEEICREDKIRWAINSFSPFKTPGPDGIIPALLQWGLEDLVPHLVEIFQACLALRYIPSRWREVTVNFIPKPGKLDYFTPKSFRPISLSSFLLKTLERLCDRYIRDFCLPTKPVNPNQHAYTQGKSTLTALHSVTSFVGGALDLKESALGVFIDIEGAFDKTTLSGINDALLEHNVPPTLCGCIENTLKHRIVKLRAGDVSLQ
nr:uncharacterized protein LOC111419158 [Onthophagus taurus]